MRKRTFALAFALLAVLGAGCRGAEELEGSGASGPSLPAEPGFRIGIITGTASQGDEEITQAERMKEKYGELIVTATYPDSFSTETETVIASALALAADPDVKAIVWCQSIPGASAAMDKVRESRPDMIFIAGAPGEDPGVIGARADLVLQVDEPGCGALIPPQAAAMGAKTLVHYSFPRHMSYDLIAARRDRMAAACEALGLRFVEVTAPDPAGDSGVTGAQQFILEDVPRQVARYGRDTAFYATNCSMQEPLIRSVLEEGAVYPLQCCPSPFHAFPGALGISTAGHEGEVDYILGEIGEKVAEAGMSGRVSTWPVPCNMLFIRAGVEYAKLVLEGKTTGVLDDGAVRRVIADCAREFYPGAEVEVSRYEAEGVPAENHYLVTAAFITF